MSLSILLPDVKYKSLQHPFIFFVNNQAFLILIYIFTGYMSSAAQSRPDKSVLFVHIKVLSVVVEDLGIFFFFSNAFFLTFCNNMQISLDTVKLYRGFTYFS